MANCNAIIYSLALLHDMKSLQNYSSYKCKVPFVDDYFICVCLYVYIKTVLLQCSIIAFQRVLSQEACSKNLKMLPGSWVA